MKITGNIIDIQGRRIFKGEIEVANGIIASVKETDVAEDQYILPGFVDSHVHIESSMVVPSEFARMAVVHGTVATVSDPHEIGNVMGVEGVEYMIRNGKQVPFKFFFGAPSCVPATTFETAGGSIELHHVDSLLKRPEIKYLTEMMNWPGVLSGDSTVMEKIAAAKLHGKVVDGHAPGLRGEDAARYIAAGISTDHECFTMDEALDKRQHGMKILIREGSAAKNFEALIDLLHEHSDHVMFCSDDKHPDSLEDGHINLLVKRSIEKGIDLFKILQAACINPVVHYGLDVGLLRAGDAADFIVIDNPVDFTVRKTFIDGMLVAEDGKTQIPRSRNTIINNFSGRLRSFEEFTIVSPGTKVRVIEALDGQLITPAIVADAKRKGGYVVADSANDILKITVINRYTHAAPAVAFVKNFGLKRGAIASSVGHDSHNIIAVGVDDVSICAVVNKVIESKGGIAAIDADDMRILPLPVAGIMSAEDGYEVSRQYKSMDMFAKSLGSTLSAPFMTLSFMALLVIPSLKISDKGLFDAERFEFVPVVFD